MRSIPQLWIFAGPNGAGKTTATKKFKEKLIMEKVFIINPDDKELAKDDGVRGDLMRGRGALKWRRKMIKAGNSFAVETTLSGHTTERLIRKAKAVGYRVNLIYVCLETADMCVVRVRQRVRNGLGHCVPQSDVRRRYKRSLENLPQIIKEIDVGIILDNSQSGDVSDGFIERLRFVAYIVGGKIVERGRKCKWFPKECLLPEQSA